MLDATSERTCPHCGETQHTAPVTWSGTTAYWWAPCSCLGKAQVAAEERQAAYRRQFMPPLAQGGAALDNLDPEGRMTLERFSGTLLRSKAAAHPLHVATTWLERVFAYGPQHQHDDLDAPAQALYFYSAQPGCGKTHLALALGHAARAAGYSVSVIAERMFLQHVWSSSLEEKPALVERLVVRPWLVLVDDLGQREETRASVRNEYYGLLDARATSGGWAVFTSNLTPDELLSFGVLSPAAHSRLVGMIDSTMIAFVGDDQRGRPSVDAA